MNRYVPCLLLGSLVSACANGVDDAADSVVAGVSGAGAAIDRQFARPARLELPFAAGVQGRMLQQQVRVEVERDYAMTLRLHFEPGSEAEAQVVRVAGSSPASRGGIAEAGVAAPVRIRIGRIRGGALLPVLDASSSDPELDGYGDGYYRRGIGIVHLVPGLYQVSVEALRTVPALDYVRVTFDLSPAPRT